MYADQDRIEAVRKALDRVKDKAGDTDAVYRAYLFSLLSIRTRLKLHEAGYEKVLARWPNLEDMENADPQDVQAVLKAGKISFHKTKTQRIFEALDTLKTVPGQIWDKSDPQARDWVADNVSGLGLAKASFFLQLLGRTGVCCIDSHMAKALGEDRAPSNSEAYRELEIEVGNRVGAEPGVAQWSFWVQKYGLSGVGHPSYFASQNGARQETIMGYV